MKYVADNEKIGDWIVFFGGEPLLVPQTINKFIKKLQNTNIRFAVYTNGLMLDEFPEDIIKKIDAILVSADGDKRTQEAHRGKGTYRKVLQNIDATRKKTKAFFVGRMTVDEKTDLYKSTIGLLKHTDAAHWQIANIPSFKNPRKFINKYEKSLIKLFDYWLSSFKKGKNLNIIPFQAIITSFIFNYPKEKYSFRCEVGKSLQTIDTDGKIYWCDELVGNKKALIGKITDKRVKNDYKNHRELFNDCKTCSISKICLGRCRKCLEFYAPEHNRVYCRLTKILVNTIAERLDEIKKIIKEERLTLNKFYTMRSLMEEIP
ncbi:MAG: SPASM domain-containing protein [Candidatus Moranbacteria bacterium]|nr:SPASM domain-containing protein [Candidatus Moranbacteria bacterium]